MSKIMVKCDCDAGDECPQGRCGSMRRCSILRDDRIEATIEYPSGLDAASRESDLRQLHSRLNRHGERFVALEKLVESIRLVADGAHIRCDVLTDRVSKLESHTGRNAMAESIDALEKREAQHDNYSHKRMDRLEKVIEAMRNALHGTDHEGENVKRRLDDIGKQFGTQQTAINAIVDRLDEAYAEAQRQTERTDNLEKHCEALQDHIEALLRTREIVTRLIDYMGLEVGDYGKVRPKRQEASIKRVYKGGWVNVEHDNPGMPLRIIGLFKDKAKADACALTSRIACIQIPDITEGDGL